MAGGDILSEVSPYLSDPSVLLGQEETSGLFLLTELCL